MVPGRVEDAHRQLHGPPVVHHDPVRGSRDESRRLSLAGRYCEEREADNEAMYPMHRCRYLLLQLHDVIAH